MLQGSLVVSYAISINLAAQTYLINSSFHDGNNSGTESDYSSDSQPVRDGQNIEINNTEVSFQQGDKKVKTNLPPGYEKTNFRSHNQKVFYNKKNKTYITPDAGGHIGGIWKMAKSLKSLGKKKTRMGTYDAKLNRIGD